MTTLGQSRLSEFERIASALRFVAARWWWVHLGQRVLAWLAGSVLLLVALAAAAGLFNLPANVRFAMLIVLLAAPAVGLAVFVAWPLRHRLTPAQAARQIEQELDGLENQFINAVQLAEGDGAVGANAAGSAGGSLFEPELVRRTIDEIAKRTSDVPVDRAVTTGRLTISAACAGLAAVVLTLFIVFAGGRFAYGLQRIWHPSWQSWLGSIRIDDIRPGNKALLAGDRLTIEVEVSTSAALPREPEARLWIRKGHDKDYSPLTLRARRPVGNGSLSGSYFFTFPSVDESFSYYVSIADTNGRDEPFQITVRQAPQVASLRVQPRYPAYLKHEQPAEPLSDGNFEAPLGSTAAITVEMNRPLVSAELAVNMAGADQPSAMAQSLPMGPQDSRRQVWQGVLAVNRSEQYRLIFRDEQGQIIGTLPAAPAAQVGQPSSQPETDPAANLFTANARPDNPPTVQILRPGQDGFVKPGGLIDLTFQASDDHGLTGVRLMVARVKPSPTSMPGGEEAGQLQTEPPQARHAWAAQELHDPKGVARKVSKITYTLNLSDKAKFPRGDRLVYWAEATDNRDLTASAKALALADGGGPQRAESARFILTIQDPAEMAANQKKMLEQLTAELLALLKEQTETRAATVALAPHEGAPPGDLARSAPGVKQGQLDFADHLMRLAKGKIVTFDPDTRGVQTSLLVLAYNDSADARALADGLVESMAKFQAAVAAGKKESDKDNPHPVKQLVGRQDRIIYALQSLLGMIGQVEKRTEQASTRPDGTDLPPDAQDKWRKLAADLEKFIDQQKKDIAVSQTLAKKPVDDFTKEDLLKLAELAAQQEKWEKFLDDKISDFSKLAEQDFSNPSLLKELIEIKDDVVMAKDALKKKAVEIAVPLEESGLELAEALTTHIEKWLPDTPDREKWSMEEPKDQTDVPMAELPKELEDMVGPLMEQEEDLFDEVEDVTSKWTDSLDKGAGWDAMDGPISNMSAQGVTGNRLPNTSEISGRSGEGREGKSSGEMVENEATGKGGRRTPTRLSGDAFQAGQVKDSSKEPPGGATGGGKVSGVAGEGLEGPVPPALQKELQRLAGKQASIRNKAEAVDARFRANNFNNFALDKAITIMRQTELDLSNYRYQNALRKKAVLVNNLQAQQMLLRGEIHVQTDTSPQLPDIVRSDVRNANDNDLPTRYKDLAKQYLQTLSEEPTANGEKK